ncbi:MAG: MATE family efflux transporter [Lachnospiraceae bacterium]|nr:MATE family efflux transporter [Lachnospiraceae bacterium]
MKDLTTGYPARVIIMFTIPMMLGYILQQLYSLVDSKIVSEYVGPDALAAIGATVVVSNLIISFVNGLTQGFAIPIANSFGAKDMSRLRKNVAGTILLTFSTAVMLTALSLIFIENILIALGTPIEIRQDALDYVRIILSGIILTAIYNCSSNILRAVGNSKVSLYCLLVSVVANIGLDILFVSVFNQGIKGAAYATIIAQSMSAFLCAGYLLAKYKEILPKREDFKSYKGMYGNLVTTGLSMGLMGCIVHLGTVVLQSAINDLGTNIMTAHTAARRVFDIMSVTVYTFGLAMTTFVSQNMGAGKPDRVRQGVRHANIIVTIISTVLIVLCYTFARPVFEWVTSTNDPSIVDSAVMYAKISILFFYALGPLFVFRCTLQGMGRKIVPLISSVTEMIVKILSAFFLVPAFAYKGVAFTEPISWVLMTLILATAYVTGRPEKYLETKIHL